MKWNVMSYYFVMIFNQDKYILFLNINNESDK